MAKRQNVNKVPTDALQGPGSFVVLRSVSYDMAMAAREKMSTEHTVDEEKQFVTKLLSENVVEWDWVDNDDLLMPTPAADPEIIKKLTVDEVEFLISALTGGAPAETKN
ncbi:MAG: hypothetical protein ACOYYS_19725 [Chloroflexota bacterium]